MQFIRKCSYALVVLILLFSFFYIYQQSPSVVSDLNYQVDKLLIVPFLESNYTYFIVHIFTILFPFLLSFDKKVAYWRLWGVVLMAATLVAIPYIIADHYFTSIGVWGFNTQYTLEQLSVVGLPIEEILFFFTIPFSCTFIYVCIQKYFPNHKSTFYSQIVVALIYLFLLVVLIFNYDSIYAGLYTLLSLVALLLSNKLYADKVHYMLISFLISIIPFLLINGVLTGAFTQAPVVVYTDIEHLGYRVFSIPITDLIYGFSHLIFCFLFFERLSDWFLVNNGE